LGGAYIYGDYCTGRIWLLRYEGGQVTADSLLINAPFSVSSFGVDQDGELYICNYGGNIQRFVGGPQEGVPCEEIDFFAAKCNANGVAQAMVRLLNSTQYVGETVEFLLDNTTYPVVLEISGANTIGRLRVPNAGPGQHTITLTNPAGCLDPVMFTCQVNAEISDPGFDALWAEVDELNKKPLSSPAIPLETRLRGNYPNPFNAISSFEFSIATPGHVKLRIYDLVGREVATVVDEELAPGTYTRQWDAKGVASGVYIYRLSAGSFTETKSMILIK
jgi:hypothetical protein